MRRNICCQIAEPRGDLRVWIEDVNGGVWGHGLAKKRPDCLVVVWKAVADHDLGSSRGEVLSCDGPVWTKVLRDSLFHDGCDNCCVALNGWPAIMVLGEVAVAHRPGYRPMKLEQRHCSLCLDFLNMRVGGVATAVELLRSESKVGPRPQRIWSRPMVQSAFGQNSARPDPPWPQAHSCAARAPRDPREQKARPSPVLRGRPAVASSTAPSACFGRYPAATSNQTAGTKHRMDDGLRQRSGRRTAACGLVARPRTRP